MPNTNITSKEIQEQAELLDIGLWQFNLATGLLEWDTSVYKRYGVSPKDFPKPDDFWHQCLTPESHARIQGELAHVIAGEKDYHQTLELVLPSGETRFLLARAKLVRDAYGKPAFLSGMNVDVTQQTLNEREKSRLLTEFREAQTIAHTGSWSFDLQTQELAWSSELHRIYEIAEDEPKHRLYDLYRSRVHPGDQSRLDQCINRAIETGEGYTLDYRLSFPDGRIKYVQGIGLVTPGSAGKPTRLGGTCRDRTNEEELRQFLERERARSMQSSKLSSLGQLAAGIAHEINNPLAIIEGALELLSRSAAGKGFAHRVEVIRDASRRIAKIVLGLKKFSRTDETPAHAPHAIADVIQDALVLVGAKARRHGTPVYTDVRTRARLSCDSVQIEQVLINLISNSIDAVKDSKEKWVKVTVVEEGSEVILRVVDSGPGIPEHLRENLFTPFFTTKKPGEGTGLGLTICKGILDSHGASIELITTEENTCFEIRFRKGAHGA